jgi:hypothetical protein
MTLDGKLVILRGPAGRLARYDAPNTGPWGSLGTGWRGFIWDDPHAPIDVRCRHRATKQPDGNYVFAHELGGVAGADATRHSGSILDQFYYAPDGQAAGGYETWRVYDGNENGAIEAQIEYTNDEGRYFSCPLAVEVVE